ncbi:Major Facilitator Superfamily protein [Nonomuraea solani]|uniref:Major Facilitator Superfamily protein n=1 Tax=Nonomuraea solani TaxID=1144553 RepID=A0A1H6F1J4_9ACTN|nr:MFS transporter [Nonomuraea solani]SEH02804.1 Major Facilitator Superfamily protein [Nonomuraea solani]
MYKNSLAVAVLAFGVAVGTLQMTVVVPLLPLLQQRLGASLTSVSWTLTAGLLSGAVSIPLLSRLGDMYGRRLVTLVALGLLVAGSALGAVSDALAPLIAARVLQGTGATLLPLAMGLVRQVVPGHRLPSAIGVLSATIGVGSGGGMILAGLVDGDHRAVFWALTGLGALAFALVAAVVRETPARNPGRPDLAGAALVSGWLVCLLLALSKGATWGWTSPLTLGLFGAAVVVATAWVVTARRTAAPLIEIPMLLHRGTVGATVASFLLGFALFATITTVSAVVQGTLGASVLRVGIYLLPTTTLMLVVSVLAGPLMRRFTASALVAAGSALVTAATLWLAFSSYSDIDLYGAATVLGLGLGLGYAALGTMAVEHVEPAKTAAAGGVNGLVRIVGGSLAGAVVAAAGDPGWSFGVAATAALLATLFAAWTTLTLPVEAPAGAGRRA